MTTPRVNGDTGYDNHNFIEERSSKTNEITKYVKGKFLGKGGFAKCYEFTIFDTKQIVASKIIPKASLTKSRAKQKLMSEIKIHRSLSHTNIVKFTHFFEDYENVYILLELCTNQTMNELIRRRKRLTELEVQCYMVQIMSALKYLHKNRVIHRDLKLGNLFLSDKMEIKLGDFGLATKLEFEGERKRTICGTPNYIAPEILEGSKKGHSYEVDIWSVGVIMYTLLIGKPPFETNDVKTTYRRIKMNAYTFPENIISASAKDLITRILQTDPSKRPSIDDIMNHDFFNSGNSIPKLLPVSTLACPPSASYTRQFYQNHQRDSMNKFSPKKLESTVPVPNTNHFLKERKDFINTDRTGKQLVNFDFNNVNNQQVAKDHQRPSSQFHYTQENKNEHVATVRNSLDKFTYLKKGQKNTMTEANLNLKSTNFPTQPSSTYNLNYKSNTQSSANTVSGQSSEIWVKKWVDYSAKYGLGYLLNTGSAGAFFNDSTKIILDKDGKKFEYIERKGSEREDIVTTHTLTEYPESLRKKVTLLQHFKNYLEGEKQNKENKDIQSLESTKANSQVSTPASIPSKTAQNIYVKKWLKTKHAIMFRLSNKVVQVIFQDQTEIILSSELKIVTYVNKKHERMTYPLASALETQNQEMQKRLKYTKDILTHMLGNQPTSSKQQQDQKRTNKHLSGNTSQEKHSQNNVNKYMMSSQGAQKESEDRQMLRNNKHTVSGNLSQGQNLNKYLVQGSEKEAQRTNKHSVVGNTSQENHFQQQGDSLSKYTPSIEKKHQYASNPIYGSLGKSLKNNYTDEKENYQSQISSRLNLQKQISINGFNFNGSGITSNNQQQPGVKSSTGYDSLQQMAKSQSTAGRMSALNAGAGSMNRASEVV